MDKLEAITRLIDEHRTIRNHIKLVGESLADREALFDLEGVRSDWVSGRVEGMMERHKKLQQTLSALDEGFRNHIAFEEEVLPDLLGELLTRALLIEHVEIIKNIENARKTVRRTGIEGVNREKLMEKASQVRQVVDGLCLVIEEHAKKEESIIEMLSKSL